MPTSDPPSQRKKRCSVCRELLPWDAVRCPECGAGRPQRPEAAERAPVAKRPWYLPDPRVSIAVLTVLSVAAVVLWWVRREDSITESVATLRAQQSTLLERIAELEGKRLAAEQEGGEWKQVARQFEVASKSGEAAEASRKADAAFSRAASLAAILAPLRDQMRAVEQSIRALGETP